MVEPANAHSSVQQEHSVPANAHSSVKQDCRVRAGGGGMERKGA
jgi:hypothetical protein